MGQPSGSEKKKVVPFPSLLSSQIFPPWASTIILQITNPKPVPFSLAVLPLVV